MAVGMKLKHINSAVLLISVSLCTLSCGQLGEAEFVLGPEPSTGLGTYNRVGTLESPHGQEFSWISSAPCSDESLLLLGGLRSDGRSWFTLLRELSDDVSWQETTDILPDIDDATLHCGDTTITIFAIQNPSAEDRVGKLWTFARARQLSELAENEIPVAIASDASSPSLRVSSTTVDALYLHEIEVRPVLSGQRFLRPDFSPVDTIMEELEAEQSQRDLSVRSMSSTEGEILSILTAFGRVDGKDSLWMSGQHLASPTPINTGESYTSQNFVRWKDAYWFIGTRRRPTVPLGLILSKEHNSVPTLHEIH